MKVIKKINNNVAVCLDNNEHELIAFGKGIGFPAMPYELLDLSLITRTYYGVDPNYFGLVQEIDESIFEVCAVIIDYARNCIESNLNPNVVFTLADHINFAIERIRKGIEIKLPLYYELSHLYEKEVAVGKFALKEIRRRLHVYLAETEAYSIALHLINAEEQPVNTVIDYDSDKVIDKVTKIIEACYDMPIRRDSFNYSRFVSHMQYLFKRKESNSSITSENSRLFQSKKEEYPMSYACALDIQKYFEDTLSWHPSDEEVLYLMLHINRLCAREDCNQ